MNILTCLCNPCHEKCFLPIMFLLNLVKPYIGKYFYILQLICRGFLTFAFEVDIWFASFVESQAEILHALWCNFNKYSLLLCLFLALSAFFSSTSPRSISLVVCEANLAEGASNALIYL